MNLKMDDPYADKGALRTIYYVRYGIVVVDVIYCAIIDGGRCVIPLPDVNIEVRLPSFRIGSIINNDDRLYNEHLKRSKIGVQLPCKGIYYGISRFGKLRYSKHLLRRVLCLSILQENFHRFFLG